MSGDELWRIEWHTEGEMLAATEPSSAEIEAAAAPLAAYYNDAHNQRMMAHDADLSAAEVVDYYRELRGDGGRPFLLERAPAGGPAALMGDADLRNVDVDDKTAEFAIMIGARDTQGRGIGTRFAVMVHGFAFRVLGLERIYVSIIPANAASRRLFEKLGYDVDDSPEAREYTDEDSDLTMSIQRHRFEAARARELDQLRFSAHSGAVGAQ
jgi:RimJ/RimL family protein N-acetyltransferase